MKSLKKKNTRFAEWVRERGIKTVAYDLGVDVRAVRYWLSGHTDPRLAQVRHLKVLARGRLTYMDIVDRTGSKGVSR